MDCERFIPSSLKDESPAAYADRLGRWYAAFAPARARADLGQYFTPVALARAMARFFNAQRRPHLRVLDPGAGTGVLSCALLEVLAGRPAKPKLIELESIETDPQLARCLVASLAHAKEWLGARGIVLSSVVSREDFVLTHAGSLGRDAPDLFGACGNGGRSFDAVICNPPYFKLRKADPRAEVAAAVVHGQPNIYALFMAVSASLLRPGGELVFITPRSFAAGAYFRRFRQYFFGLVQPAAVHLFDSRRATFARDDVLQENVILRARRKANPDADSSDATVMVSSSFGLDDLHLRGKRKVLLSEILSPSSEGSVLRIPVSDEDDELARLVRSWPGSLRAYGLEISTGPVVPFRAIPLLAKGGTVPQTHAPLLWMQSVTHMRVHWPAKTRGKCQYLVVSPASLRLLLPDSNYVVLRRFSAKEQPRRLTAAPLLRGVLGSPFIGLENHLNYIHRPGGSLTDEEAYGLAAVLNSNTVDRYFRSANGNTQVNAEELRALPLPPMEVITEIGRRAMSAAEPGDAEGTWIEDALTNGGPAEGTREVALVQD